MHIGYMTSYGWLKDDFESREKLIKDFDDFAKTLEKNNCKLLFWSGAYGVQEPYMYAIKFNDIKDWEKGGSKLYRACPLDRTRTIFGWDYKD